MSPHKPYPAATRWNYRARRNPRDLLITPLWLVYELNLSSLSDDYTPDDATALELWEMYLREAEERYSTGDEAPLIVTIAWFVAGPNLLEAAPFQDWSRLGGYRPEDFLTHFTHPDHAGTNDWLNFLRLPVRDQRWTPGQADKGGFIQEVTGWKPSPLQPSVDLNILRAAAGIAGPVRRYLESPLP